MLDHLNDDCLCEIFQYLSVREQLIVTTVNERFCDLIVENIWRKKYNKFTIGDTSYVELNLEEFRKFYNYIVPHIQELELLYVPDLKFSIYSPCFTPDLDFFLHFEYPSLRSLCYCDEQIHSAHLSILNRKCPHIEKLWLHSAYASGEHLASFHNLRELYLYSCKVEAKYIGELLAQRKIRRMHLTGKTCVKRDMDVVLQRVFPHITELQYFDLGEIATQNVFNKSSETFVNLEKLYCCHLRNFVYTLRTLRELYFETDFKVVDLFKLVENNVQLENLYMGTSNEKFFEKSPEWLCGLMECLRAQHGRKVALSMHINMSQLTVQDTRQFVLNYDMHHGHLVPVLKIQKLSGDRAIYPTLFGKTGIELSFKWS